MTSACSVRQSGSWSILHSEQGEVGWANVWKTQGGAVRFLTDIYSLVESKERATRRDEERRGEEEDKCAPVH